MQNVHKELKAEMPDRLNIQPIIHGLEGIGLILITDNSSQILFGLQPLLLPQC
jgi:hypothetical protein